MKDKVILQQAFLITSFNNIYQKKQIPHAILFSGVKGSLKSYFAIQFASFVNCSTFEDFGKFLEEGCSCPSCNKIADGNHPDIFITKSKDSLSSIQIDEIRQIIKLGIRRPHEASYRFVIIEDADKMSIEASNAILKVIEEAPAQTIFILTTSKENRILKTILSRCQSFYFNLDYEQLEEIFISAKNLDEQKSKILLSMLNSSEFYEDKFDFDALFKKRNFILDYLLNLYDKSFFHILLIAEALHEDKHNIELNMKIIKSFFSDLLISKIYPQKITNIDFKEKIEETAKKYKKEEIIKKLNLINDANKALRQIGIVNVRLFFEDLFLKLKH